MEFNKYISKNTLICCYNSNEITELFSTLSILGIEWPYNQEFQFYEGGTCFNLYNGTYGSKIYYLFFEDDFKIINFKNLPKVPNYFLGEKLIKKQYTG